MEVLRRQVFTEVGPTGGLEDLLLRGSMEAIEILDRGAKGLGGTLRIDLDTEGPRDWVDFVLAVGAPPDSEVGGGTYGFGKTASYAASCCSTILIWSVTEHEGKCEHRFIASAINEGFSREGRRYTGRQWWGRVTPATQGDVRVEPILGDDARQLGEAIFERPFTVGDTGTSILILAPRTQYTTVTESEESEEQTWRKGLSDAIIRGLWPKLIADQPKRFGMRIRAFDHGAELALDDSSTSPTLAALERCLRCVRIGDEATADLYLVHKEVWSQRPKLLLGHLALTRYASIASDPLSDLSGSVTFMRSPELVVGTQINPGNRSDSMSWVAVFKPLDEHDQAFAAAEPPAHDVWAPYNVTNKDHKRLVSIALSRVKEHTREFLTPKGPEVSSETAKPTAAIAARLGALAGTAIGARPVPGTRSSVPGAGTSVWGTGVTTGKAGTGGPRARVVATQPLRRTARDLAARRERSLIVFEVDSPKADFTITATQLRIVIDGGLASNNAQEVRIERWLGPEEEDLGAADSARFVSGFSGRLEVSYPMGIAIDVILRADRAEQPRGSS